MSLIYVCTDFDLTGPSPREKARIGLLLSCLYGRHLAIQAELVGLDSQKDIDFWRWEDAFVLAEMEELMRLLPETKNQIMKELAGQYE